VPVGDDVVSSAAAITGTRLENHQKPATRHLAIFDIGIRDLAVEFAGP
jgi:hypothetical protein